MRPIDRDRLIQLIHTEERLFVDLHPRSRELSLRAQNSLLGGVPMNWMVEWASPFTLFVQEGMGAYLTDVDGHRYLDLCLGDTGAMTGHSPPAAAERIVQQARRGLTYMLPTEDSVWVGEELARRFGLPYWQFTLTATDANRFALRLARQITGRRHVLVFNRCYHGTVDESFITLKDRTPVSRPGNIGPPVDPTVTSRVVEFNDISSLEAALAPRDIACVLAEPAMTNVGIILPDPGFHEALRQITLRTGTLLIVDETHTLCAGPGGCTRLYGLRPDMLTLGKAIASGVPAGAYGISSEVAERLREQKGRIDEGAGGIGGTLAGNALTAVAMRATLSSVLTAEAYAHTVQLAQRFEAGVRAVIEELELPWNIIRLGCRAEYSFRKVPAHDGGEAVASADAELDRYMHLASLNRGILMTPFHNMALIAPDVTEPDIDLHSQVFREIARALVA